MSKKNEPLRRIDQQRGQGGSAGTVITTSANTAPPAIPLPPPPTDLTVGTMTIYRSSQAPLALVPLTWRPPGGQAVPSYLVEIAGDSAFTSIVERPTANQSSASLLLPTGRTFYVRVYAQHGALRSAASASVSVTTPVDTTPAAQPTGVSVTFVAGGDLKFLWTNPPDESFRDVEIRIWDSSSKTTLYHTGYSNERPTFWTINDNRQATSNSPDPSVYYELRSRTWAGVLNSTSPPSGTVTDAAPSAPSSVSVAGIGVSGFVVTVTATPPGDFAFYRYRIIQTSPSAADVTVDSVDATLLRAASARATYQVGVRIVDVFGQTSAETLSSAQLIDALTLADLRSAAIYSDSIGTAAATLKAALADGNRASGGQAYASGTGWKWTQIARELQDRYQPILITATAGEGYVGVSNDGSTWAWYSGPLGGDGRTLTSVASEAAAQSAALTLPTGTDGLWYLPATVEARHARLGHRNTAAGYTLREYYAERVVEGDLIRAGTVRALQISVNQLSAISANLGTITAGTVTGATIQTAASGARIELTSANGLRSYNSGGTLQVQIRTSDGALTWGAGVGVLNADGMAITGGASSNRSRIRYMDSGSGLEYSSLEGDGNAVFLRGGTAQTIQLGINRYADRAYVNGDMRLGASGPTDITSQSGRLDINGSGPGGLQISATGTSRIANNQHAGDSIDVGAYSSGSRSAHIDLIGDTTYTDFGLRILRNNGGPNTESIIFHRGAGWMIVTALENAGIRFDNNGVAGTFVVGGNGNAAFGNGATVPTSTRLVVRGADAGSTNSAFIVQNSTPTNLLRCRNDGALNESIVSWTITSDRRAKRAIADLEIAPGGIDALLAAMRPRRYKLDQDADDAPDRLGFVAQEWQQHPLLATQVRQIENGQLGIIYDGALPIFALLLRRAFARIAQLEARAE